MDGTLGPTRIDPDGVYHDGDARLILRMTEATMQRTGERAALRYTRQGHRILYRGQWLLDWLDATAQQGGIVND